MRAGVCGESWGTGGDSASEAVPDVWLHGGLFACLDATADCPRFAMVPGRDGTPRRALTVARLIMQTPLIEISRWWARARGALFDRVTLRRTNGKGERQLLIEMVTHACSHWPLFVRPSNQAGGSRLADGTPGFFSLGGLAPATPFRRHSGSLL